MTPSPAPSHPQLYGRLRIAYLSQADWHQALGEIPAVVVKLIGINHFGGGK